MPNSLLFVMAGIMLGIVYEELRTTKNVRNIALFLSLAAMNIAAANTPV